MFQILALIFLNFAHAQMPAHNGHADIYDENQMQKDCAAAGFNERLNPAQRQVVNSIFATRAHRLQHSLWHAMRSNLTAAERRQAVRTYGAAWGKFHPLCPPPENNPEADAYNPAGEDFFYMHHQMVLMFESAMLSAKQKCISPWRGIPDPRDWPLNGVLQNSKSEEAYGQLLDWDRQIQSRQWLRQVSLSQLGWALEFTIHNNLHARYATDRPSARFQAATPPDGAVIPLDGKFPRGWKYDELKYNWLADPYASATNPIFWKIHGYVDHILAAWLEAHGKTRAAVDCAGDIKCYTWRGTWIGARPVLHATRAPLALRDGEVTPSADDFLRKRLANQRLGEIMSGRRGAHAAQDLISTARQTICP